jgi:ribosome biogenesis SPOUT family RNA methylase Rps3
MDIEVMVIGGCLGDIKRKHRDADECLSSWVGKAGSDGKYEA